MKTSFGFVAAFVLLVNALPQIGAAQIAGLRDGGRPTLAPLMRAITPGVVSIATIGKARTEPNPLLEDPSFRRFFGTPGEPGETLPPRAAAGSGVIVDARNGYVLTNHHVVEGADEITVTLADRRELRAKLVGSDPGTDIALLQVTADGLTALELGNSDTLQVGDFVVAVGNPFGIGQTVTSGIVSALGRAGLGIEGYEDFIQTDAAINPGNSGGALVDLDGKVVGVNAAILSPTGGGNVGIGFAVPVNMARAVMDQLIAYGEVRRGRLGVSVQDVTPDLAKALEIGTARGAIITSVEPSSAAARAGLEPGDVVTSLNGTAVGTAADLRNRIGLTRAGETVVLAVSRNGRPMEVKAKIGEAEATRARAAPTDVDKLEGVELGELERGQPLFGRVEGVVVLRVAPSGRAWRAGLRVNDVILAVNRHPTKNREHFAEALRQAGSTFALDVRRGDARMFIVVP